MRLELEDNFIIKTLDANNLGICKRVVKDNDEYQDIVLGYHNNLYTALNSYVNKRVIDSEADGTKEIFELLKDIKQEIKSLTLK